MLFLLISISLSRELHLKTDIFDRTKFRENIYISSVDGGFLSYNPRGNKWNKVTNISGLFSNNTGDFFITGDTVWVLSEGGITLFYEDLSIIDSLRFNPLFFNDLYPNTIDVVSGNVILGGETGIQWFSISDFDDLSRVDKTDYGFEVFEILSLDTCFILGTSNGIYRTTDFSGSDTVKLENLSNTYFLDVIDGSLWAGGSWGCRNITEDTAYFSTGTVHQISKIRNDIFAATSNGLYRFNGEWNNITSGNLRGVFWPECLDTLIVAERGEGLRLLGSVEYIKPPGPVSNVICDLVEPGDGNIYLSHRNTREISSFDGINWKIFNSDNEWNLPPGILYNIESDSRGTIYFGFWYWNEVPLIFEWNPSKDSIPESIELPISLTTISGMEVDSKDNIWIAGFIGLDNYVLKMQRVPPHQDSLDWTIYSDPAINWVRVFAEGKDYMYCGNSPTVGGAGIHILQADGNIKQVRGNLGGSTISMNSDIEGNVWAGLENNFIQISGDTVVDILNSANSGLLSDEVNGIEFDFQGGMWCYQSGSGISYRNPEGKWQSFRGYSSVESDEITEILHFTDNGNLFVCTYGGLYEIDIDFNIPEDTLEFPETNVYPNPYNTSKHNYLIFSSSELPGKSLYIYDINGKLKTSLDAGNQEFIRINSPDFRSGLYFFIVEGDEGIVDKGKFVVIR